MILITGGLGHIGSYLIRRLKDKPILIIDSLETQRYTSLFNLPRKNNVFFTNEKIQDWNHKNIRKNSSISSIIHLAAHNEILKYQDNIAELENNNLGATMKVLEIASHLGVPVIFPSSTSVYSQSGSDLAEKSLDLKPLSSYAKVKLREEKICEEAIKNGTRVQILRFGTICGVSPGMRFHTAINSFCFQHSIGKPIEIWGSALFDVRPYLSILDASRSIEFVLNKVGNVPSILNVATENLSVNEIIQKINKVSSRKVQIDNVQNSITNNLSFSVSTQEIQRIGFKFKGKIEKDIRDTLKLLEGIHVQE